MVKRAGTMLIALGFIAGCAARSASSAPTRPAFETNPLGTWEGHVTDINEGPAPGSANAAGGTNAVVTLRLDGKPPVVVYLAPGWHLDERGWHFSREDYVTVTGEPHQSDDHIDIVARSIRRGNTALEVRDPRGQPLWPDPANPNQPVTPPRPPSDGQNRPNDESPAPNEQQPAEAEPNR